MQNLHVLTTVMKYSDSRTFKGLLNQIRKLSRPYSVFKDFPGPGKMTDFLKEFQRLSRPCGHPVSLFPPFTRRSLLPSFLLSHASHVPSAPCSLPSVFPLPFPCPYLYCLNPAAGSGELPLAGLGGAVAGKRFWCIYSDGNHCTFCHLHS